MSRNREFEHKEILKKALDLFWVKGYSETSMQDLVDHLGLGRGSIYNAFGSKKELFMEVLEYYDELRLQRLVENLEYTTIKETMKRFLYSFVDLIINDDEKKGCLFINTSTQKTSEEEGISDILARGEDELMGLLIDVLTRAVENEEFHFKQDVRSMALFFSSTIKGLRVFSKSDCPKADLLSIADTALLVLD